LTSAGPGARRFIKEHPPTTVYRLRSIHPRAELSTQPAKIKTDGGKKRWFSTKKREKNPMEGKNLKAEIKGSEARIKTVAREMRGTGVETTALAGGSRQGLWLSLKQGLTSFAKMRIFAWMRARADA
jgi:hypothetical protein